MGTCGATLFVSDQDRWLLFVNLMTFLVPKMSEFLELVLPKETPIVRNYFHTK